MNTLQAFLKDRLCSNSQSMTEVFAEASCSDDQQTAGTGIIGLVLLSESTDRDLISRLEDFALSVEKPVTDDELQALLTEFYQQKGYEITGTVESWMRPLTMRKPGLEPIRANVTNDSGWARPGHTGPIYITIMSWPYPD